MFCEQCLSLALQPAGWRLEQKAAEMFPASATLKLILSKVCLAHLQAKLPLQGEQGFPLSISSG